jgi:hypothetical protein
MSRLVRQITMDSRGLSLVLSMDYVDRPGFVSGIQRVIRDRRLGGPPLDRSGMGTGPVKMSTWNDPAAGLSEFATSLETNQSRSDAPHVA